jgi:hypothetical protein
MCKQNFMVLLLDPLNRTVGHDKLKQARFVAFQKQGTEVFYCFCAVMGVLL